MQGAPQPALAIPRVIGHRGAAAAAPENTLAESLRKAKELGAEWVEFDVELAEAGKRRSWCWPRRGHRANHQRARRGRPDDVQGVAETRCRRLVRSGIPWRAGADPGGGLGALRRPRSRDQRRDQALPGARGGNRPGHGPGAAPALAGRPADAADLELRARLPRGRPRPGARRFWRGYLAGGLPVHWRARGSPAMAATRCI